MPLQDRLKCFKKMEHAQNEDFYKNLSQGQNPHTLFIACSDSRVSPETLLQARAGEIFHIRNVANIVPREETKDNHSSVVSAIEYAVIALDIDHIVVCGHSNCGGCKALMHLDDYRETFPYTSEWISQSEFLRQRVQENFSDRSEEAQLEILEMLNAAQQVDNLMTYDFIRERVYADQLHLYAIYYDIASGEVYEYKYDQEDEDLLDGVLKWNTDKATKGQA